MQHTSQRWEVMFSPKTAVKQITNTGRICRPEKVRAAGNLPATITKAEFLVQTFLSNSIDFSQISIDSLNYTHIFKSKTADHQPLR